MTTSRTRTADEKFCISCGQIIHAAAGFCSHCGISQNVATQAPAYNPPGQYNYAPPPYPNQYAQPVQGRDKWVAVLLAFFLGGIGIHKFYLGKTGQGIIYLLFCWTFIPSIIAFIEFIIYLFTPEQVFRAKYPYV